MDWQTIGTFGLFIFLMTITPGPGNLTFMAIGSGMGYRKTFPIIIAALVGVLFLNLCIAFGLGQIMLNGGIITIIFKSACMAYMAFLAWRILNMTIKPTEQTEMTIWDGLIIHPLNPKTWAMSAIAFTTYFSANDLSLATNALILSAGCIVSFLISHSLWTLTGATILNLLGKGKFRKHATILMVSTMLGITTWSLII